MIYDIFAVSSSMAPRYKIGQKVIITPVKPHHFTPRDVDIEGYTGRSGEIIDYYWITLRSGVVIYIYSVQVGDKEIVLHEDEIESYFK